MIATRHTHRPALGLALAVLLCVCGDVFVTAGGRTGQRKKVEVVDVAIVGAGVAGLTAAYKLEALGYSVKVLEARNRICGRMQNQPVGDTGYVVEGGGQWVGPTQDRALALIDELGLETFQTILLGLGMARLTEDFVTPFNSSTSDPDSDALSARLDELAAEVPLDRPWEAPNAGELDAMTFADWVSENVKTEGGTRLVDSLLTSALIESGDKLSLLFVLYWLRSVGGAKIASEFIGGAQDSRVVGGTGLICEALLDRLSPGSVVLAAPVTGIIHDAGGAFVRSGPVIVKAKRVVLTCHPQRCGKIRFRPGLPQQRVELQDALNRQKSVPTSAKLHFVYKTPFWREDGKSGLSVSPITGLCVDNSPPDGKVGIIMCFGSPGFGTPDGLQQKDYLDEFEVFFGPKAQDLESLIVKDWGQDSEWAATCVTTVPPGVMTTSWRTIRDPIGVFHFAGAETSTIWMGYIDGAVRSAEKVTAEIASEI